MSRVHTPFFRILVLLISGILIENSLLPYIFPPYILMLFVHVTLLVCILLFTLARNYFHHFRYKVFTLFLFFWLGILTSQVYRYVHTPQFSQEELDKVEYYTAIILSKPDTTDKFIKYLAGTECLFINNRWISVNKKALLYFDKSAAVSFSYGDIVLVRSKLQLAENNGNPHAFDYGLYLQRKGIFLQDFIFKKQFTLTNLGHHTSPRFWGLRAGDLLENTLTRYIRSQREAGVVKAMVLGRRNEITPEMNYVYRATGTAHILAVSGLHVGIVFLMVSSLFKFLNKKKTKLIFYLLVILSVWSYAFITGFSPSVQRAAIMFSFITLGKSVRRKGSIYNTILASAFFVLLFSPNLIYSVSFQLSYAAVLSIVYLYPKIYPLLYVKNKILNFFWQITVLSVSVQIMVFPITIYYFGQFPVLFALTNLMAVPTATAVLAGSFGILIFSFTTVIPTAIGTFLEYWIYFYNEIVSVISLLPFAQIQHLHLKGIMVFLILWEVFLLIQFLSVRQLKYFKYFTFVLVITVLVSLVYRYKNANQQILTFYRTGNQPAFDIFIGNECFTNIEGDESDESVYYNVLPNRRYRSIDRVSNVSKLENYIMLGKNGMISVNGRTVLLIRDIRPLSEVFDRPEVDDVVIGKNMVAYLPEIIETIAFRNLILDRSVDRNDRAKVRKMLRSKNIHALQSDGAYTIRL